MSIRSVVGDGRSTVGCLPLFRYTPQVLPDSYRENGR